MMHKPAAQFITQILNNFNIVCPEKINLVDCQGDLTNDSRTITEGDVFCAIIGQAQDGRQYIDKAIASGAKLVLTECENKYEHGSIRFVAIAQEQIAVISFYQLNKNLFALASAYYQAPQQQMTMIGITGTNGKTSTSHLLGQLLTLCNKPCAIIGTNGAGMVDDLTELQNTTPSATDLMQLFYRFSQLKVQSKAQLKIHSTVKEQSISHITMEVSSHALEQGRVSANVFNIAVFTNLSRDHLDYHGTMANYAAAKRALFIDNKLTGNKQVSVLNGDDEQVQTWLTSWPKEQNKLWLYGRSAAISKDECFVSCQNIKHLNHGVEFTLVTHLGKININSPLLGDFNIDNLLAAISVLLIEGISLSEISDHVANIKPIAGRMEVFSSNNKTENAPDAVVDYAHTPDALAKALIACRQHCSGELTVVFGCGGDRDKGKRPLMAKVAEKYADKIVVTNDNPRTENAQSIVDDVLAGLSNNIEYPLKKDVSKTLIVNLDREQAVLNALAQAQANDMVLLAGKGHEDYIIIGTKSGTEKVHYNERQIVADFFTELESTVGEQA